MHLYTKLTGSKVIIAFLCGWLAAFTSVTANEWEVIGDIPSAGPFMRIHKLSNEEVLVFGSVDKKTGVSQSHIVNLRTKKIQRVGDLNVAREISASAVTPDGTIYAIGGGIWSDYTTVVERYNPKLRSWEVAGEILVGRQQLSAVALSDKNILIVGGRIGSAVISECELFDTESGTSIKVQNFPYATSLGQLINVAGDGVFAFAGRSGGPGSFRSRYVHRFVESSRKWRVSGETDSTYFPTLTEMPNGVWVWTGGSYEEHKDSPDQFTKRIALFVDGSCDQSIGELIASRAGHACAVFGDQQLLVTGGNDNYKNPMGSCELINTNTGLSESAPELNFPRGYHVAISSVIDGRYRAIVVGGVSGNERITPVEMIESSCLPSSVSMINGTTYNYILRGSAYHDGEKIVLTDTTTYQAGALWLNGDVDVANPFAISFAFSLSSGNDHTQPDGGPPGADGIALVIQNYAPSAVGEPGRGIGYDNLLSGIAVEFDSYQNGAFGDPAGSHVAVQTDDGFRLRGMHVDPYLQAITTDVTPLIADGSTYYAKLVYDGGVLSVYLSKSKELTKPCIVLPISITEVLKLGLKGTARIGFTSATGIASEKHTIEYINIGTCTPLVLGVKDDMEPAKATINISPNPVFSVAHVDMLRDLPLPSTVQVVDVLGAEIKSLEILPGTTSAEIYLGDVPQGMYFVVVRSQDTLLGQATVVVQH